MIRNIKQPIFPGCLEVSVYNLMYTVLSDEFIF